MSKPTKEQVEELTEQIRRSNPDESDAVAALDEMVHDAASCLATEANNGGLEAQVAFLLEHGQTAETILEQAQP
jgi:hypothetical protein